VRAGAGRLVTSEAVALQSLPQTFGLVAVVHVRKQVGTPRHLVEGVRAEREVSMVGCDEFATHLPFYRHQPCIGDKGLVGSV
jgi:hypothetical protein